MSTPWHVVQHAESTSVLINATPAMTASYSIVSQAPAPSPPFSLAWEGTQDKSIRSTEHGTIGILSCGFCLSILLASASVHTYANVFFCFSPGGGTPPLRMVSASVSVCVLCS